MKVDTRRSVTVTIRFYQDKNLVPKKAYAYGKMSLNASKVHGINYDEKDFNTLEEFMLKLDGLLKKQGVSLHHNDLNDAPRLGAGY